VFVPICKPLKMPVQKRLSTVLFKKYTFGRLTHRHKQKLLTKKKRGKEK